MIAVAIAALRDSDPGWSAGYGGIYNLSDTISAISSDTPADSFPMTMTDADSEPLSISDL